MGSYLLQRVAFPEAGATNQQILATVYVKNLPAHVSTKKIRRSPVSPRPEPPSGGRARGGGSWW